MVLWPGPSCASWPQWSSTSSHSTAISYHLLFLSDVLSSSLFFFVFIFFLSSSFSLVNISFFFCAFHYHYSSFSILFQFCILRAGPSLVSRSALRGFPSCGAATSSLDSSRTGRPILKSQRIFTATRFVQLTYQLLFGSSIIMHYLRCHTGLASCSKSSEW